jgi:hypothetical protein
MTSAAHLITQGMIQALSPAKTALDMIDAYAIREARAYRAVHRLPVLNLFKSRPETFFRYLSEYRQRSFLSTAEAAEFFTAEKARLRDLIVGRNPFQPSMPPLKRDLREVSERLVFARFFRRYGMRAWTIQQVAA